MKIRLQPSYRANIPRLYVYQFLFSFFLFLPFWVIYVQNKLGLSIAEATLVDVAFWLGIAVAEIPTGAVADTYGRKLSMIWAVLILAFGSIMFVLAPSFWWMMFANFLWSVGFTFDTGASMSLMFESLQAIGEEDRFTKERGRMGAVSLGSVGLAAIVGGILTEYNPDLPFIVYAGVLIFSLFFILGIKEPQHELDPETGERIGYYKAVSLSFKTIFTMPDLRNVILFDTILPLSIVMIGSFFIQPFAISINMPIFYLGIVVFGFRIFRMLGSFISDWTIRKFRGWRVLFWSIPIVFVGTLFLGLVPSILGIFLFALAGFAQSVVSPFADNLTLKYSPSTVRATILSIKGLFMTLFISIFEPGLGWLADQRGLPVMFVVMAFVVALPSLAVLLNWRRSWKGGELEAGGLAPAEKVY